MTIELEHRNEDETTWSPIATLFTITATGTMEQSASAIKEICRLKYSFTGGSDGDGFHVIFGAPSWRPY